MNVDRKVRLTVICPLDPFSNETGGAETWVRGFIKYAPDDFEVEFIGFTTDAKQRPPRRWNKGKLGGRELSFFPLFLRTQENRKPRIPMSLCFTVALQLSRMQFPERALFFNRIEPAIIFRKQDNPKIAIVHNDILKQHTPGLSEVLWSKCPWAYFMLEKLILKSVDSVYTVSNNTLSFYRTRYDGLKTKFAFIPTSADPELFYPGPGYKRPLKGELCAECGAMTRWNTWVLFVGRLQEQKNPRKVIDTFAEYLKKNREAGLIIIGDRSLRSSVEEHVKELSIGEHVVLLGNVKQDTLARFYRASDVLLLTSNFEGMPICVLEGLACGTPVVTTDVGEVKKVVIPRYSGEIAGSPSPSAIAGALERVLSDPKLYSQSNCVKAASEYRPQRVMQPLYDAIRELATERYGTPGAPKPCPLSPSEVARAKPHSESGNSDI